MSFHIYVARDGFKSNPISTSDWMDAARQCPKLDLSDEFNRSGVRISVAKLKSNRRQHLSLDPHGLIHAQDPTQELVEVMFELAGLLNAGVYSEKLTRFQSVDDWRDRTNSYRMQRGRQLAEARKRRRRRMAMYIAVIASSVVLGGIIGGRNAG
ncbi:hypothetical protein QRD43_06425 [Pelomonas sp. APW6]|uniref:Uncharacterized protein n=1 Tax=Roseateles subflavus TaxID=3053353 RepID=A0ABT7LH97_9BURK|nr:hypothetical protein [Pelomonas sp. APW6]MDL5031540.1 hypothetical protein [Pelomonas sp. APW6]